MRGSIWKRFERELREHSLIVLISLVLFSMAGAALGFAAGYSWALNEMLELAGKALNNPDFLEFISRQR